MKKIGGSPCVPRPLVLLIRLVVLVFPLLPRPHRVMVAAAWSCSCCCRCHHRRPWAPAAAGVVAIVRWHLQLQVPSSLSAVVVGHRRCVLMVINRGGWLSWSLWVVVVVVACCCCRVLVMVVDHGGWLWWWSLWWMWSLWVVVVVIAYWSLLVTVIDCAVDGG